MDAPAKASSCAWTDPLWAGGDAAATASSMPFNDSLSSGPGVPCRLGGGLNSPGGLLRAANLAQHHPTLCQRELQGSSA